MGKITSEVLTGIFSASYTPCHQTHVALRSVTELYLAFYVYKCFLFMLKGGLLCTMCVREGTCFPFQLAVRAWENKISSFLLPLFHSTSSTHQLCMATCHWPLPTPIFFPSLRLHMYDHTTQHCIWGVIVQNSGAQAMLKFMWLCAGLEIKEGRVCLYRSSVQACSSWQNLPYLY